MYQADRLHTFAAESDSLAMVTSSEELKQVLKSREDGSELIAGLLGTEGLTPWMAIWTTSSGFTMRVFA